MVSNIWIQAINSQLVLSTRYQKVPNWVSIFSPASASWICLYMVLLILFSKNYSYLFFLLLQKLWKFQSWPWSYSFSKDISKNKYVTFKKVKYRNSNSNVHIREVYVILMGTPPDLQGEEILISELQTWDCTIVVKLEARPFFCP